MQATFGSSQEQAGGMDHGYLLFYEKQQGAGAGGGLTGGKAFDSHFPPYDNCSAMWARYAGFWHPEAAAGGPFS